MKDILPKQHFDTY